MTSQLHPAILPLLQNQHACFGHRAEDPACAACVVESLCAQQRDRRLAEFALEWERFHRLGNRSEMIPMVVPAPCSHCRQLMLPDDGKVLCVEGRGTYHPRCVELAFPSLNS